MTEGSLLRKASTLAILVLCSPLVVAAADSGDSGGPLGDATRIVSPDDAPADV